jgi:protein-S-isoprenylcysteine O-methyltransferase Ste14
MGEKLLLVPWLTGMFYASIPSFWLVIHPLARHWQAMPRSPYRFLLPFWAATIGVLGSATWAWHSVQVYSVWWMWLPALLLFVLGLSIYRRIGPQFGIHNFAGASELRPKEHAQVLVTSGLHMRMRHPIYFAHLCMFTGWTIGSGLLVNFVLLALSALLTFPLMIWLEERELERRFGQSFRQYQACVPLFPLPFRARETGSRLPPTATGGHSIWVRRSSDLERSDHERRPHMGKEHV